MKNEVNRIIQAQTERGESTVIDALRTLAGAPARSVQVDQHFTRRRVMEVQRDQNGNIISSIERIEEVESGHSSGLWTL